MTDGLASKRILLSVPHMGGNEERYVREAFATNWLSTTGPNVAAFEAEFEGLVGLPAAALNSGTAAIHLGLRLLGVGPGDLVLCPTLTFVATANPIRYLGAEPVFIDSERGSWNMDPELLQRALSARRHKAVIVVHLYGQCAQMDAILELCSRYEVPVLEDTAEALGATHRRGAEAAEKMVGTLGDVGVFSFNGNKIITTTGGGMLVAQKRELVERARFWATQAREPGIAYEHAQLGYNYRLSNVLAGISLMPQASYGLHTNWLSCFLIREEEFGCTRDELIERLVWKPMHRQPLFASAERYGGEVADDLHRRGICLPSSSNLTANEQLYVINRVRQYR